MEILLAWRKEIREEARERLKYDPSLTYDEAIREAKRKAAARVVIAMYETYL
jgi:hypothetical protein